MPRGPSINGLSIGQLQSLLQSRLGQVQKFERQRNKLARKLDQLDRRIEQLGGGRGTARRGRPPGRGRAQNAMNLTAAIEQVLKGSSKPMRVGDIADAVEKNGYRSTSANFRGIVNQSLIKDKRFGKAGRGLYQLKK